MEILIFHQTTDNDLTKGLKICYKDINGNYSKLGIITDALEIDGVMNYIINTAMGAYTADELKLIKQQ